MPVQLAPLFFLLFATFAFNCVPTPVLAAASAAMAVDADGGEDGDPITPAFVTASCEADQDEAGPFLLSTRETYLDHHRFCGASGASVPQIDDFGDPRGFEARGPPGA